MSSKDLKIQFREPVFHMNCHDVFLRFSSGHFASNGISVTFGRDDQSAREMPARLIDEKHGMRAWRDLGGDFGGSRFIASVSHRGMTSAAPLPCFGQIPPKI